MKENAKKPIYKLSVSAIFIALSTVLSMIKVYEPPLGGGVTLFSMVPVVMISCMFGIKWGLSASFVYSLGQLFISFGEVCSWGLTPLTLLATFAFDYLLAYFVLGISGVFSKKGYAGYIWGTALALVLRFLCHFATGVFIFDIWCEWDNVWIYSLLYNGGYMLPELIITVSGVALFFRMPQIKKIIGV